MNWPDRDVDTLQQIYQDAASEARLAALKQGRG